MQLTSTLRHQRRRLGAVVVSTAVVLSACAGSGAASQSAQPPSGTAQPAASVSPQSSKNGTAVPSVATSPPPTAAGTPQAGTASQAPSGAGGTAQPGASATGAAPSPSGTANPSTSQDVRRIFDLAASAYQRIKTFEGTATITATLGQQQFSTTVNQWYDGGKFRLEVAQPIPGIASQGAAVISDGRSLALYLPDRNTAYQVQDPASVAATLAIPQSPLLPATRLIELPMVVRNLETTAQTATPQALGTTQIAGRTAEGILLSPGSQPGFFGPQRFWFDQQTGLPLRAEIDDSNNQPILRIDYTSFQPDVSIDSGQFNVPADALVQQVTVDQLANALQWQETTLAEARQQAGYPVAAPTGSTAGVATQRVMTLDVNGTVFVMQMWNDQSGQPSTTLVQGPAGRIPVNLQGTSDVSLGTTTGHAVQIGSAIVIGWSDGRTDYVLATNQPRTQAIILAAQIAHANFGTTPLQSGNQTASSSPTAPADNSGGSGGQAPSSGSTGEASGGAVPPAPPTPLGGAGSNPSTGTSGGAGTLPSTGSSSGTGTGPSTGGTGGGIATPALSTPSSSLGGPGSGTSASPTFAMPQVAPSQQSTPTPAVPSIPSKALTPGAGTPGAPAGSTSNPTAQPTAFP